MKNCYLFLLLFFPVLIYGQNNSFPPDFDFYLGEWNITNHRLKERLNNNQEWQTFPAKSKAWKMLDGMVVIDEFFATIGSQEIVGSNYRIYDSSTGEWTIYWASTASSKLGLMFQVKGKFNENGEGLFYGEEQYNGKLVKLRFLWKKISKDEAYWEQAYLDEKENQWETNWKMEFKRIK